MSWNLDKLIVKLIWKRATPRINNIPEEQGRRTCSARCRYFLPSHGHYDGVVLMWRERRPKGTGLSVQKQHPPWVLPVCQRWPAQGAKGQLAVHMGKVVSWTLTSHHTSEFHPWHSRQLKTHGEKQNYEDFMTESRRLSS